MLNAKKLKGKMLECEMTIAELATAININKATLYKRISNKGQGFRIMEINSIITVLGLTQDEANSIFFPQWDISSMDKSEEVAIHE
jgi:predicted transcriptional regulator